MSYMKIPADKILEFHYKRTSTHISCLNYFAGLLGYHFPEHDNDKTYDPIKTGYAYINWAKYHEFCQVTSPQRNLYNSVRTEHYRTQPHHIEYYTDVSKIPNIHLVEMVCDWHSANFEQRFINPRRQTRL